MKKYQSSKTRKLFEIDFVNKRNKCPECTNDRKKKSAKDLQYFKDTNTAYCFHCNTTFFEFNPYEKTIEYTKPIWKNKTDLTNKAVQYFENRKITQDTLLKLYNDNKFDEEVYRLLIKIIENKRSQKEKHTIENIKVLDNFIETQLKIDEAPNKRHFHLPEYFNDVIIKHIFNKK